MQGESDFKISVSCEVGPASCRIKNNPVGEIVSWLAPLQVTSHQYVTARESPAEPGSNVAGLSQKVVWPSGQYAWAFRSSSIKAPFVRGSWLNACALFPALPQD